MQKTFNEKDDFAVQPVNNISNFIQAEVNLEKLPFFTTNKTSKFDIASNSICYFKEFIDGDKAVSISWKVMAVAEFGLPNHLDRDIYRGIQKIISKRGVDSKGYVSFSTIEIINLLGHKKSGYISSKIKESLNRMVATTILSEGAFYSKEGKEYISETFHLFDSFIARGQKLPDGSIAEYNYIKIHDAILKSMISGYVKPVDFDYYISLDSPNAKALYSKLSVDFYGLPECALFLQKRYSVLCKEILITYQKHPSKAKYCLKKAFDELISTGFISKVEFVPIKDNPHDFYILFYPGVRAKDQHKFKTVIAPELEAFQPSQPLRVVENKNCTQIKQPQSPVITEVVESVKDQLSEEDTFLLNSLIKLGMSEDKAKQCATEHKEKTSYWLKAKDHYSKSSSIRNTPAFIYKAITSNWVSTPYEEYLKKKELKQQQQEEEQKKVEEDKKLLQSSAKGWEEWINLTKVIESLDVNVKQDLYNFVKKENKCHPFYSRLEVNQSLTVTTLTGFKDSFIRGIKALNIDVKGFKHLLD